MPRGWWQAGRIGTQENIFQGQIAEKRIQREIALHTGLVSHNPNPIAMGIAENIAIFKNRNGGVFFHGNACVEGDDAIS